MDKSKFNKAVFKPLNWILEHNLYDDTHTWEQDRATWNLIRFSENFITQHPELFDVVDTETSLKNNGDITVYTGKHWQVNTDINYNINNDKRDLCRFKFEWIDVNNNFQKVETNDKEIAHTIILLLNGEICLADLEP